jgi:hypothetical protein
MSTNISIQEVNNEINNEINNHIKIKERKKIYYTPQEKERIVLRIKLLLASIEEIKLENPSFKNQIKCSKSIVSSFENRKKLVQLCLGLTQAGKTGVILETLEYMVKNDLVNPFHIFVITGLSSVEWKKQTGSRLPSNINLFHLNDLKKFKKEISGKKNCLIIIDEAHIASLGSQTILNSLKDAGLDDKEYLYSNDIKILEVTATPGGIVYDLNNWKESKEIQILEPGENYTSCFDLYDNKKVYKVMDLCCIEKDGTINKKQLKENSKKLAEIISLFKNDPMYHCFRISSNSIKDGGEVKCKGDIEKENIINIFKEKLNTDDLDIIDYDLHYKLDINDTLKKKPSKHTLIFIKEKMRCAYTLKKKYVGIVYERYTSTSNYSSSIQGLLGRMCGYDYNGKSVIFADLQAIINYRELWKSKFEDKYIPWYSTSSKYNKKHAVTISKGTYNNEKLFEKNKTQIKEEEREPIINIFNTQEEGIDYHSKTFKSGTGPRKKEPNKEGFYEANIRGVTKVYSCKEIYDNRKCNIDNCAGYAFRPCYTDINDITTIKWYFIHNELKE